MQFINVRLLVTDIKISIAFWRDVIGLNMTYSDEAMGYAYFETGKEPGSAGVELMTRAAFAAALGEAAPPAPGERPAVLVFRVEDVDSTYNQFMERGAKSVLAPQDHPALQIRSADLSDPDGYLVEIYRHLAQPNA
jgi:lactoylglutathione lyase